MNNYVVFLVGKIIFKVVVIIWPPKTTKDLQNINLGGHCDPLNIFKEKSCVI